MRKDLDEALCRDFPLLFGDRKRPMDQTAMCWGFQCGDGWEPLIRRLSEKLEPTIAVLPLQCYWCSGPASAHATGNLFKRALWTLVYFVKVAFFWLEYKTVRRNKWPHYAGCRKREPVGACRATTVKEKFGGLRVYLTSSTDEMEAAIDEAEAESFKTCEECGAPGVLRSDGGWLMTACDSHAKGSEPYKYEEEI